MRLPHLQSSILLIALAFLPALRLPIAFAQSQDPSGSRLHAQDREKVRRELEGLRDRIDQILKDLERSKGALPPDAEATSNIEGVAALKLDRVGSAGGGLAYNMVLGWEFAVNERVEVTDLGVWDSDTKGLEFEFPVGIWDTDGKLILSGRVPAGEGGRLVDKFRYVKVTPTALEPGRRYGRRRRKCP